MSQEINAYCDESCHLENDRQKIMVLGAIWCPLEKTRGIAVRLREIKERHGLKPEFEIKWTKVSLAKKAFYLDIVDYFFDDDDLHFRGLIVSDKTRLRHKEFSQDHDTWYYKMYFEMLNVILAPDSIYRIYLDIKDTKSQEKVRHLQEVLCNSRYDFDHQIIRTVQSVRSHEVEQLQLADLLIGAVSYVNRGLTANPGKIALISRIKERSTYALTRTTLLGEKKFNLFRWDPK